MDGKINETLEKDTELRFPHIYSVEASAGSGKTYTLTLRVLQFLLSRNNIPDNKLTNILGITFTNNSAKEMKTQVLGKLKSMRLGLLDAGTLRYISDITDFGGQSPASAAENLIDGILSNYHDFQIRTIDSFTSKILKASAAEIGLPPDFEISTESSPVINYAVINMVESAGQTVLDEFLDLLDRNKSGDGIDFNPVKKIKGEMKRLLETESDYNEEFSSDFSFKAKLDENLKPLIEGLKDLLKTAENEGLEIKGNFKKDTVDKIKNFLNDKNYFGLVNDRKGFPYKNRKKNKTGPDEDGCSEKWEELFDGFDKHLPDIAKLKSLPYLTLYESFKKELINAYKISGLVYISDINKKLSRFLSESSVPEIYFQLGNNIYHYFIDEFQDTSKVQWRNLKPLIEESLSKGGSLFTVGDLKQALYGFRGADYKIMKALMDGGGKSFPSLNEFKKVSLKFNFRSDKVLVDYVNNVFKSALRDRAESVGDPAGFLTYGQDTPLDEGGKNINAGGCCLTEIFKHPDAPVEKDAESAASAAGNPLDVIEPRLMEIIEDLKRRGYGYGDIAVLAQKNRYLNDIAGRLIEKGYPVVTQSSLDIRNRKIIKEIEMLLNFLNSPTDDFNFGGFILGDIFGKKNGSVSGRKEFEKFLFETNLKNLKNVPLYIEFREKYENLWNGCFEELFNKTGYLPPYEIVLYIYKVFNIPENFPEESAYLAHFLDAIQYAEEKGSADLNDFLDLINPDNSKDGAENEIFSLELPKAGDALTLLTVHKAKGLQWDAVINVFFAEENYALRADAAVGKNNKGAKKNYFAAETDTNAAEGNGSLNLLYITKKMFKSSYLESVYYGAVKDENISDLNTLYVALTRAKHEMYNLIISKGECPLPEGSAGEKFLKKPEDKDAKRENEKRNEQEKGQGQGQGQGQKNENENANVNVKGGSEGNPPENLEIALNCGYCDIGFERAIKTVSQYLSIKRGDFYHKILSEIKYAEDFGNLDALIEKYMLLAGISETKTDIKEKIERIKENNFLLKLFDGEIYEVFTEKEYLSAAGSVCRMDRVSVSEKTGEICILDYKTGDMNKKEAESYKIQLLGYKSVLKDIYAGKKISAVIYNIDSGGLLEC